MDNLKRQLDAMLRVVEAELESFWEDDEAPLGNNALPRFDEDDKRFAKDIRAGHDWLRENLDRIVASYSEKKDA